MSVRTMKYALMASLALAACDGTATEPLARRADLQGGNVVATVTGAAQFHNEQGFYRRMEISASKDHAGVTSGTLQWVAGAAIIRGTITCLTVQGNVAWVGGVVESARFTAVPAGSEFHMAIVDNGEGHGAQDQTTSRPFLKAPGAAQAFCAAAAPPAGLFAMDNGNVRIQGN